MEISDVELWNVPAAGQSDSADVTLVCIATTSGLQGWGEGQLGWPTDQLPQRARMLLAVLAGRSIFDVTELIATEMAHDPALACAVEVALWDLISQQLGQPLCNLWGGAFRTHVPLAVRVDVQQYLDNEQHVRELIEHGFHQLALACTGDVQRDVDAVRQLHLSSGPRCSITLDGQLQYSPDEVLRLCRSLPENAVTSFLDPVAGDDLALTCWLARLCPIPLAISRAIHDPKQVMAVVRDGGPQGIYVNPHKIGGLLAARRALASAAAGGLTTSLYLCDTLGPSFSAMIYLAACEPHLDAPHLCQVANSTQVPYLQGLSFIDGTATVRHAAGLGVELEVLKTSK